MSKIYTIILIFNEPLNKVMKCLNSVKNFSDHIRIIYDTNYEHAGELIARLDALGVHHTLGPRDLEGSIVEEWRNGMIQEAEKEGADWVLIIDPDEEMDFDAESTLRLLKAGLLTMEDNVVACAFPRKNYERLDEHSGFIEMNNYPDHQIRLVKPHLRYSGKIHEHIIIPPDKMIRAFNAHIIHDKRDEPYEEFLRKLYLYRSKGGKDNVPI